MVGTLGGGGGGAEYPQGLAKEFEPSSRLEGRELPETYCFFRSLFSLIPCVSSERPVEEPLVHSKGFGAPQARLLLGAPGVGPWTEACSRLCGGGSAVKGTVLLYMDTALAPHSLGWEERGKFFLSEI